MYEFESLKIKMLKSPKLTRCYPFAEVRDPVHNVYCHDLVQLSPAKVEKVDLMWSEGGMVQHSEAPVEYTHHHI